MRALGLGVLLLLGGCLGTPPGVEPVGNFDAQRYLGTWYEIARLDHVFERGLDGVTATYSLNDDGSVRVLNRGYSAKKSEWSEAEGVARFVGDDTTGHLKVSFFGPFYASYVVFELDQENYDYAFVSGFNNSYLWLLARTPEVSAELQQRFVRRAGELGFAVDELLFVDQSRNLAP
ncbi:lipocalin family protein [Haliea sp. E1-2-M8]|uniref:lipocalin family protein n=1 Tax=Haliea sp. E1-2-M8 TaxID=3064706 RepID=UPI002718FA65|nr:lipocalin family protein [Haliea sp. E1-2-M8]MDO8860567.1 lipocalin family protein [Haliea sp. E1-2-M8]